MDWNIPEIRQLIVAGLAEDAASDDITTQTLIGASWKAEAEFVAKQSGVVAGLPLSAMFFEGISRQIQFTAKVKDGARVRKGQSLARVVGPARALLIGERPALNALQYLSGIATFTAEQVKLLGRTNTKLFDTRKTLPGWRQLAKYAVRCGGAENHRMALGDAMLIKENHLQLARDASLDWVKTIQNFRRTRPDFPVQIEIQTAQDLREAIAAAPQRVLLDNMSGPKLRHAIRTLRRALPKTEIEISGGVRPEQLRALGRLGVERISMGRLTHSAPNFDCSLNFKRIRR